VPQIRLAYFPLFSFSPFLQFSQAYLLDCLRACVSSMAPRSLSSVRYLLA
jgi:hypothetical protein